MGKKSKHVTKNISETRERYQERESGAKYVSDIQKTSDKMTRVSASLSVITLNVNRLYVPIKRHQVVE